MDKGALKELVYGGVQELLHNREYYYHSSVGVQYSHWTEAGTKCMLEYMNLMGDKMIEADAADLRQRAKDMTIAALKGESV